MPGRQGYRDQSSSKPGSRIGTSKIENRMSGRQV
jgi:hypothetical protein